MKYGVFIPIGNNGWLISTTSPQYMPSFDLNRAIVEKAERYGFDFALSMIKLRGFGGPSEFWDHNLESFTLMAGLASVTTRIRLFASVAVLTIPPPLIARMAATIDDISGGRFGVNIVSGWQKAEYTQMGLWPGESYFDRRYEYCSEYATILRELWSDGRSDFKGDFFRMDDCRLSPRPATHVPLVAAGQSGRGMQFAVEHADYNFLSGRGVNTPESVIPHVERLRAANAAGGGTCKALVLLMIIADESDETAMAKWDRYVAGTDTVALSWQSDQASSDRKADGHSTAGSMRNRKSLPTGMLCLVGSYASVARQLDGLAAIPDLEGAMLTFDDFLVGMDQFGQRIQPLLRHGAAAVA